VSGWTTHVGTLVQLAMDGVDTDQLIPARFMSRPRADGYGDCLLHDLRRDAHGERLADFPLERHPDASILLAGHDFGCGSSREAAVYALVDAGIRVIIAPGFGDIFAANAINNGLLPARIDEGARSTLQGIVGDDSATMRVSLEDSTLSIAGTSLPFALDDSWRTRLVNGWDDIDLTLAHASRIARHRDLRRREARWAWPADTAASPQTTNAAGVRIPTRRD